MNQQRLLRKDIGYLVEQTNQAGLRVVNGDITRFKTFDDLPIVLVGIKPTQKTEENANGRQQLKFRVDITVIFAKIPEECSTDNLSDIYDDEINRMSNIVDNIHLGLTERYLVINGKPNVENPIAHERGYETDGALDFLSSWFSYGSNKYMKLDATFTIKMPYKRCLDCSVFKDETFSVLPSY